MTLACNQLKSEPLPDDSHFIFFLPIGYCRGVQKWINVLCSYNITFWREHVNPTLTFHLPQNFRHMTTLVGVTAIMVVASSIGLHGQDPTGPKFTVFAGPGATITQGNSRGEFQAGASFDVAPPGLWYGYSLEGGYLGPYSRLHAGSAFASVDYMTSFGEKAKGRTRSGTPYWSDRGWKLLPFASAGYTKLFGTGNAVNFGGGFEYRLPNKISAIRAEVRDYYSFSTPPQHNVALRIGFVIYIGD
jgi:hypothetical protein